MVMSVPQTHTILIVEDDLASNNLWVKSLRNLQTNVTGVTSLGEAFDYLDTYGLPDVIILDLELPDGLGTDLLRVLRNHDAIYDTRIVIISANIYASHIPLGEFKPYIAEALLKPVSPRGLSAMVNQLLGKA